MCILFSFLCCNGFCVSGIKVVKSTTNIPYLPADRPHPRIGRTSNFQWFSWEKKICRGRVLG